MEDRVGRSSVGFEAFAIGTTVLPFPQMGRNAELGTEQGDRTDAGNGLLRRCHVRRDPVLLLLGTELRIHHVHLSPVPFVHHPESFRHKVS